MDKITQEELAALKELKSDLEKFALKSDLAVKEYNLQNINLKYYILSLYRKYNIEDQDRIDDNGNIIKKEANEKEIGNK